MKKPLLILTILFGFVLSCNDSLCFIAKEPELDNKEFPIGSVNDYYYADLNAEINNEPRDDDYDYYFDVQGLPQGLDFFVNFRTISVEGTPLESGVFSITIYLDVDGPFRAAVDEEPDILCNYSTSKNYMLIIE
ncbi:hypothetical protein [uncultured Winogradskyella sp.]|uniref:hypothetical protein n=1 Tax=uncultured Winogradskyella sp. TaxID=395353 RepID=UPI002609F6E8|nr:hypothetical protein [uncultured Winogradskyella sp.]